MASEGLPYQKRGKRSKTRKLVRTVRSDIKPLQAFYIKFNNDWSMNLAAALAYNLLTAIFPIILAIISILGFLLGNNDTREQLAKQILHVFPSVVASPDVLKTIFLQLNRVSGLFGIIAFAVAIFGGSRLFVLMENCFGFIYNTRTRSIIPQNVMAVGMLLVFTVLTPIMIIAASGPAFVISLLQRTPLNEIPGIGFLFGLGTFVSGLIVSWILFQTIYMVVPNQRISFRKSWLGAVVAAFLLQLFLTLFSLYVARFLKGFAGEVGFAIILITFFYYFAVILVLGAEINAFIAEGIRERPTDLVTFVHNTTNHYFATKAEAVNFSQETVHTGPKERPEK